MVFGVVFFLVAQNISALKSEMIRLSRNYYTKWSKSHKKLGKNYGRFESLLRNAIGAFNVENAKPEEAALD